MGMQHEDTVFLNYSKLLVTQHNALLGDTLTMNLQTDKTQLALHMGSTFPIKLWGCTVAFRSHQKKKKVITW